MTLQSVVSATVKNGQARQKMPCRVPTSTVQAELKQCMPAVLGGTALSKCAMHESLFGSVELTDPYALHNH